MSESHKLQQLFGVDVSKCGVFDISKEKFIGLGLEKYPQNVLHLLVHAVQFGYKIPSLKSMLRTEKKNLAKVLQPAGSFFIKVRPKKAKKPKKVQSRKRAPNLKMLASSYSSESASRHPSARRIASYGQKKKQDPKVFRVKSPQQIALKSARQICVQQLKKYKATLQKQDSSQISEEKVKPINLTNKKINQKRRRHERWQLIKQNKAKLLQMYGKMIFTQQFHMSRKDIQAVLERQQGGKMQAQGLGQLIVMVDESEEQKGIK